MADVRCRMDGVIADATRRRERGVSPADARQFFEQWFTAQPIDDAARAPLLTGYFEIELQASRVPAPGFEVPLHGPPPGLVTLVSPEARGAHNGQTTHVMRTASGDRPAPTRAEVLAGALDDAAPVIAWLKDPVDAFVLHVQGSGRLTFADGQTASVRYAAKNGHPYVSIGRTLVEDGVFSADALTLDTLVAWLKADRARAARVLVRNPSYIFFEMHAPVAGKPCPAAVGVREIALVPGRSIAVDSRFHDVGWPVFVVASTLTRVPGSRGADAGAVVNGLARLCVAHDAGSGIQGGNRADLFCGRGEAAGRLAGAMKHGCQLYALRLKAEQLKTKEQ